MKIWIIADTHFYHDRIVDFCDRPKNHTELIIANWAKTVQWDDLTIHLGDVIFKEQSKIKGILAAIPGKKILVKGNHDHETLKWYMEHGFDFACHSFVMSDMVFTHAPLQKLPENIKWNIHGHLHNGTFEKHGIMLQSWHKLFAIENTNYKPVLLDDFINEKTYLTEGKFI
jgi:calcineurin-like phosphoesterase family protein